jgi:hypothetical protein
LQGHCRSLIVRDHRTWPPELIDESAVNAKLPADASSSRRVRRGYKKAFAILLAISAVVVISRLCGTPFTYSYREKIAVQYLKDIGESERLKVSAEELAAAIGLNDWLGVCSVGMYMHFEAKTLIPDSIESNLDMAIKFRYLLKEPAIIFLQSSQRITILRVLEFFSEPEVVIHASGLECFSKDARPYFYFHGYRWGAELVAPTSSRHR